MRQIPTSPFPSQGRDPVAEAVSADYGSLFVANQDDNTIVQFVIGTDGKLYPFNTVNTPGIFPLAIAATKSNLFVVDTLPAASLCSTRTVLRLHRCFSAWAAGRHRQPCARSERRSPIPPSMASTGRLALSGANASARDCAYRGECSRFRRRCLRHRVRLLRDAQRRLCLRILGRLGWRAHASERLALCGRRQAFRHRQRCHQRLRVCHRFRERQRARLHRRIGQSDADRRQPLPAGNQPSAIVVDPSYPFVYVANSQDAT